MVKRSVIIGIISINKKRDDPGNEIDQHNNKIQNGVLFCNGKIFTFKMTCATLSCATHACRYFLKIPYKYFKINTENNQIENVCYQ